MHQYKNIKHRHTQNWGGERECKEIKQKPQIKILKKITNNGKFFSAISSRTEKQFPKISVTPSWEFVVAPAGYNFTP